MISAIRGVAGTIADWVIKPICNTLVDYIPLIVFVGFAYMSRNNGANSAAHQYQRVEPDDRIRDIWMYNQQMLRPQPVPQPVPQQADEPDEPDEIRRAIAASLATFHAETELRKLDRAPSGDATNPKADLHSAGMECTLMGSAIPPEYVLLINGDPFDVRYFVKAILTQPRPINPYTKDDLSENLDKISRLLMLSPSDFENIWKETDEKMVPIGKEIDQETQREVARRLGDLPDRMRSARMWNVSHYNQLAQEATEILRGIPDAKVRKIDKATELRTQLLSAHLIRAEKQKKCTPQYLKGFCEVIGFSENPLDREDRSGSFQSRRAAG